MAEKIKVCERCGKALKNGEGGSYRRNVYVTDFEKRAEKKARTFLPLQ